MMSSEKDRKHAKSQTEYDLGFVLTEKHTRGASGEPTLDIHVVTDIQVQIENVRREG